MSRHACAVNRSPLPRIVFDPACCLTSRRKSQLLGPMYFCSTVRPCTVMAATPQAKAPSRIRQKSSRLPSESSIPRRILSVTGIEAGTAIAAHGLTISPRSHSGLSQMIAAAAAADGRLDRASEIDVDDVEPGGDQFSGGRPELNGIRPHELAADGVLFVGDLQMAPRAAAVLQVEHKPVDHDLGECVGRPQAPRDDAHRPVAISAQCGSVQRETRLAHRRFEAVAARALRSGYRPWPVSAAAIHQ